MLLDSRTLGRITRIRFAFRHRLLEICQIPEDVLVADPASREPFVQRALNSGISGEGIEDIRRGVFGNAVLIQIALSEGRIDNGTYRTYFLMNRFFIYAQSHREDTMDGFVLSEEVLSRWEELLGCGS